MCIRRFSMIYLFYFIAGIIFWTFMEYMLHRFLGHVLIFKNKFRKEHQKHHHVRNYFASVMDKFLTSFIFGSLTLVITYYLVGKWPSVIFTTGFISMYLFYEYVHRSLHVKAPTTKIGEKLRKHHFYHHFNDEYMNQGVTTRFWDRLFGTFREVDTVDVNKKFIMPWLANDNVILPEYTNDYRIVERTRFT